MKGRSWSFAHDRRVIELAKASKSLEDAARIMQRKPGADSQSLNAIGRFIQNRLQKRKNDRLILCGHAFRYIR